MSFAKWVSIHSYSDYIFTSYFPHFIFTHIPSYSFVCMMLIGALHQLGQWHQLGAMAGDKMNFHS